MSERQLTQWFTSGVTPVHIGVYNISCRSSNQSGNWYAYWDGEYWGSWSYNPIQAECYKNSGSFKQELKWSWRGIVK